MHDESEGDAFDPAAVETIVDFLVERRSTGRSPSPTSSSNTIMNLTQTAQVACFRNVAALLEPGGCFVIEVGVPSVRCLPPGETYRAYHVDQTRWDVDEFDVATQGLISHHFAIVDGGLERVSIPFRYVWPSELDLMAQLAGMTLRERMGRVDTRAVHERQPQARLGMGEADAL
jgi:hypothetical protein